MFELLGRLFRRGDDTERRVRKHGWTGIYVGDYSTSPTWAYTIGFLTTLGAPEVIVFDLPQQAANNLFHEVFRQLKSGELTLQDGRRWPPGEETCAWRKVHSSRFDDPENKWLGLAEMYDTVLGAAESQAKLEKAWSEFEAFQLVLSDNDGRFPWEPEYDERLRPRQRELYLPVADALAEAGAC